MNIAFYYALGYTVGAMEKGHMQTTKEIYRHTKTGSVYPIERTWSGHIACSFGPIEDEPKGPDSHDYTTEQQKATVTQDKDG